MSLSGRRALSLIVATSRSMPKGPRILSCGRVRRRGLLMSLCGLIGIGLLWPLGLMGLLEGLTRESPRSVVGGFLAILMSAPFVLLCIGAIEAITDRPFRSISSRWNQMSESKQGVLSFLLLCLGIAFLGLALYLAVLYFS